MKTHSSFRLCAAAVAVPFALLADIVDPADYAASFDIKFAGYAGTTELTDFPALIRLSAARNAFDYSKCAADGSDLRFADSAGNLIPHEIDTWNPNGESTVWVKVPTLTRTTVIRAFYGYKGASQAPAVTATDVWDSGYVGVWHMGTAEGAFTQTNSTAGGKNIAPNASYRAGILCGVEGAVGRAAELGRDGVTTGGFGVSDSGDVFDGFSALTLEAWTFQTSYSSATATLFEKKVPNPYTLAYNFYQRADSSGQIAGYAAKDDAGNTAGVWQSTHDGAQLNEWTHQVFRWNGVIGQNTGFLNGANVYDQTQEARKGDGRKVGGWLFIGNSGVDQWGNNVFHGKIDEVRISSVARSDDWVVASHDTIANEDFASYEDSNEWRKYARKFKVSFPGVTAGATLTDFPVLVRLSETSPAGFRYADCAKANGADLRFADENGTLLPCEVEVWNPEGESLIWVKVPTLTADTRITGYYGWNLAPMVDATEVWDENFLAVWHMDAAEGSRSQSDSTANGKKVTCPSECASGVQSGVAGKLGKAARFGLASSNRGGFGISDPDNHFDGLGEITVEAWTLRAAGAEVPTANAVIVEKSRYDSGWKYAWSMYEQKNGEKIGFWLYSDTNSGGLWLSAPRATPTQGDWHYHARRWSGTTGVNARTLDDSTESTAPASAPTTPDTLNVVSGGILCIGNRTTNTNGTTPFPGSIDEVRISDVARSDAWVKATYDTIADHAAFTRYGTAADNIPATVVFFR